MNLPLPQPSNTDPWPEILHLMQQRVTFKGQALTGATEVQLRGFVAWMIQSMPAVVGSGDPDSKANSFLLWLRSEQRYEADPETRMKQQAAMAQAPANPVSSQAVPQQAQVITPQPAAATPAAPGAPAPADAEGGPGMTCPECQTVVSGMRGYKRHVTMTHKTEWPAFCAKHGLDPKTALAGGAPPVQAQQPAAAPPPPPAAPSVPPMYQASQPPQPFVAPAPPQMPTPAAVVQSAPTTPMAGMAPPMQPVPTHALPPMAAPGPMVAFNPAAPAPGPAISPGLPGQQAIPFQPQPQGPVMQQPAPAPQQPAPAPVYQQPATPAPTLSFAGPSRDDLARMLGGAVDLIIVRLLDAAQITQQLQGRVDVNQMAAMAEAKARAELKVSELASIQYGVGKQVAQRHFAELLTAAPGCYMLLNGYDPILPDGYLDILAARVTKFHMVTDGGRQVTTIF
jgi:hypothetical protein